MGRRRRLTRAHVLMYLNEAGGNRARAAMLAGVSRATFYNALRRYKVASPRQAPKLARGDAELIVALVDAGLTRRQVAAKFDVSTTYVCRIIGKGD